MSNDPGFRPEVLFLKLRHLLSWRLCNEPGFTDVVEQSNSPSVECRHHRRSVYSNDDKHIVTAEENAGTTPEPMRLRLDEASEGIFTTLGTPLLRGRFFSIKDGADAPHVAIVNETMARSVWAGRDPVGRRLKIGPGSPWFTVVGVVSDMRREGLDPNPLRRCSSR